MQWHIELSDTAERQLQRLPRDIRERLGRAIDEMVVDPFRGDVIPLKGRRWRGRYRKRVGRYRIIFLPYHETHRIAIAAILLRNEQTYR
jgi:mRNA-degrading endonuclease RelE of RelBE toxin-antitoxin system